MAQSFYKICLVVLMMFSWIGKGEQIRFLIISCITTTFVALKETRLDLNKSIRPGVIIRCRIRLRKISISGKMQRVTLY